MSATIIEQANKKYCNEQMKNDDFMLTMSKTVRNLSCNLFDQWYVDMIFQKWERFGSIDIYDAYPFACMHTLLNTGIIFLARIGIGVSPSADKCIEQNQKKLDTLWHPFSGEFWGGTQDEDGYIEVKENISFTSVSIDLETGEKFEKHDFFTGKFPLEVGYISAAKTKMYFPVRGGCNRLARWAYGSDDIILMAKK
jgi:hypothetical protein